MRELLPLFQRPSRFLGVEPGSVHKDPAGLSLRVGLAFPDLYEVGMSYLGQMILYSLVNERPAWWAERVYAPPPDVAAVLKDRDVPLCTLEADFPLAGLDVLAFHVTHELCYTTILHMLDLAKIPFRAAEREDVPLDALPLLIAGGGQVVNAEPIAPFFDAFLLGEGEATLPGFLELLEDAKGRGVSRAGFLREVARLPGVYVPALFDAPQGKTPVAQDPNLPQPTRQAVPDLDQAHLPQSWPQAFDAVHDRFTLEIGRGCTRGCRFCHAGMVYRPARERSLDVLHQGLASGLATMGYGEASFLSLSAGDFSDLPGLFARSLAVCGPEQAALSLPSLRVGSVSPEVMEAIAAIRRTGATVAPEAGTQRLRDVINKGVTEEALIEHAVMLAKLGWRTLKLYFMIGLPTETDEDVAGIVDLAVKVDRACRKQLNVSVAISPFVPKPHTPFQWEAQITPEEIDRKLALLKTAVTPHRRIRLKWHVPKMSFLEGVFSRGDRSLADAVEAAWRRGRILDAWVESFNLSPWLEAFAETGVDPLTGLAARPLDAELPWEHLVAGPDREFLLREREHAYAGTVIPDCRFGDCQGCGVCDAPPSPDPQRDAGPDALVVRLNRPGKSPRDHAADAESLTRAREAALPGRDKLGEKRAHYFLHFEKRGPAAFLSQLELQSVFERAMRRARLPLAFSQGFHPMPLVSFGRAMPVGVESEDEVMGLFLRTEWELPTLHKALAPLLPKGLDLTRIVQADLRAKLVVPDREAYALDVGDADLAGPLRAFTAAETVPYVKQGKKGPVEMDLKPLVAQVDLWSESSARLVFDWSGAYLNPLKLCAALLPALSVEAFHLKKLRFSEV